jgi:hypothetical protein
MASRLHIKAVALGFHQLRLSTHRAVTKRALQPNRLSLDESLDVLAADQGDAFARFLPVEIEQVVTMPSLLVGHCTDNFAVPGHISLKATAKSP